MIQFQQSEATAERRRWILVLVDATDGVTGLTGATGTVFVSKNGAAGVASTNSIVEVDSGDMPGHYYIELTAAELDTLGWVSISMKTASSLAFHDRAIVSYNDPYQSVGGFSGGGGGSDSLKLTKKHIQSIAEEVWKYKVEEEVTAKEKLLQAADHPVMDLSELDAGIKSINIPETDLAPVLEKVDSIMEAISNIDIPEVKLPDIKDYEMQLSLIISEIEKLPKEFPEPETVTFDYDRIEAGIERVRMGESEAVIVKELKQHFAVIQEYLINLKYVLELAQLEEPKEIINK